MGKRRGGKIWSGTDFKKRADGKSKGKGRLIPPPASYAGGKIGTWQSWMGKARKSDSHIYFEKGRMLEEPSSTILENKTSLKATQAEVWSPGKEELTLKQEEPAGRGEGEMNVELELPYLDDAGGKGGEQD